MGKAVVLISGILLCCGGLAQAYYQVIDLGIGYASFVNNNGQIVGAANGYATLFDPSGAGNNVNLWSGAATAINDNGLIIGTNPQATLFNLSTGNNTNLGSVGMSSLADPKCINNAGSVVGQSGDGQGRYAILFDSTGAGNNINLGHLGDETGHHAAAARSINNNGQIVGDADGHAVLFNSAGAGTNIDLGTSGAHTSSALSVNDKSQIVGYLYEGTGYSFHAVLFDPTGMGNNIDLNGGNYIGSQAKAINDLSQIVGMSQKIAGEWVATLFDPTGAGNNIDLNTLIDPALGWSLQYANSINNNGWIVGSGVYNGDTHAFLLITPEPATLSLLFLGFAAVRRATWLGAV